MPAVRTEIMRYQRAIPVMVWAVLVCSAPSETNAPKPVKVESGLLQGTVEDGLAVYRGIPYAAPPVGEFRWRAPRTAPSEDCLFLNVWTPATRIGERLGAEEHRRVRRRPPTRDGARRIGRRDRG